MEEVNPLQLLPPSINLGSVSLGSVTKVDLSKSVAELMNEGKEKAKEKEIEREKELQKERSPPPAELEKSPVASRSSSRDPRTAMIYSNLKKSPRSTETSTKSSTLSSPSYDPRLRSETSAVKRTTIYDTPTIESPSEDEDCIQLNLDKDKDMRPPFTKDEKNGDIDFRFPFASSLSNYVPATEIDASYGAHSPIKWELKIMYIPKPDYAEIKKHFRQSENTTDPRLKKIFGISDTISSPTKEEPRKIPLDPRKRKQETVAIPPLASPPRSLEIKTILQNSQWYKDLSSSQKMMVNQLLAEISIEMKRFHADNTPNKMFDISYVTKKPMLHQVLTNLRVFINMAGEFEEINDAPPQFSNQMQMSVPPLLNLPPQMMANNGPWNDNNTRFMPNMSNMPNMNMRPGLLGISPNMPFSYPNDMPGPNPFNDRNDRNFDGPPPPLFNQNNRNIGNKGGRDNRDNRNNNFRNQGGNWRGNNNNNRRNNN